MKELEQKIDRGTDVRWVRGFIVDGILGQIT